MELTPFVVGASLAYMRELVEYWRGSFDWRAAERAMNAVPHFRAQVDGVGIHLIHQRGRGPRRCRCSSPTAGPAPSSRCSR